ncbi:MAG: efflux RND transporter periplasmic adaptor subunit [Cytophagales bacterium]|jgi:RND family efflux transporter MFP subunit|nr:efflux RND transporter periplasmic adaptor subunit [Cytophagales bacterium]
MKNNLLLLGLLGWSLAGCHKTEQAKSPLDDASETIAVKLLSLQSTSLGSEIKATGLLSTEYEARYAFKIGGVIDRIWVQEGQSFRKGQRLAALKTSEIDAQLEQAELGKEKALRDYQRVANLYRDSVATLEQLQNAQTALDVAQKTVNVVAFNRQYAYIYANADGLATKKLANEGEVIGPGMPVLAINETNGSRNWVLKLGLNDRDWAAAAIGQRAEVTIDAFPGRTFVGSVFRKPTAADPASGTFQVEIKLDLGNVTPSVGMFGKARIYTSQNNSYTVLPYEALVEADGSDAFVFVPAGNNRVRRVPIQIDRFDEQQVVVKQGLEKVTAVVVSNSAFLNEKSIIKIVN